LTIGITSAEKLGGGDVQTLASSAVQLAGTGSPASGALAFVSHARANAIRITVKLRKLPRT